MIHYLFNKVIAKAAVKVVANVVMSPLQHIASVESIMEHNPTKNFDFHSALGFPKLTKGLMCHPVLN